MNYYICPSKIKQYNIVGNEYICTISGPEDFLCRGKYLQFVTPLTLIIVVKKEPSNFTTEIYTSTNNTKLLLLTIYCRLFNNVWDHAISINTDIINIRAGGKNNISECGNILVPDTNVSNIIITFDNKSDVLGDIYSEGDRYTIDLYKCIDDRLSSRCIFQRPMQFVMNQNIMNENSLARSVDRLFSIPQIKIDVQTNIDGSDIGEANFNIYDDKKYYGRETSTKKCEKKNINESQIKITKLNKCCPYMVSVIKGKGKTLIQRVAYMYGKLNEEVKKKIPISTFYGNIILYGMVKYILAKILYGKFNIKYLLLKYSDDFFKDLRNSNFCNFINFFEQPDIKKYYKVFRYDF